MNNMKYLMGALFLVWGLSGCATPVSVSDGVHQRTFIPCAQDELCFRNTYGIARDNYCSDFPVSYKNNDREYTTVNREWIYQPVFYQQ